VSLDDQMKKILVLLFPYSFFSMNLMMLFCSTDDDHDDVQNDINHQQPLSYFAGYPLDIIRQT